MPVVHAKNVVLTGKLASEYPTVGYVESLILAVLGKFAGLMWPHANCWKTNIQNIVVLNWMRGWKLAGRKIQRFLEFGAFQRFNDYTCVRNALASRTPSKRFPLFPWQPCPRLDQAPARRRTEAKEEGNACNSMTDYNKCKMAPLFVS